MPLAFQNLANKFKSATLNLVGCEQSKVKVKVGIFIA